MDALAKSGVFLFEAFRLDRQRNAVGLWVYTLHVQPVNS